MKSAAILLICLAGAEAAGGDLVNVSIRMTDGVYAGLPQPVAGQQTSYAGVPLVQRYVEFPQRGKEFEIHVTPKVVPLCIVVAVDGHNSISGQRVASFTTRNGMGRGYILTQKQTYAIRGWRESATLVRRFRVVEEWRSVSWALKGDPSQAGTIAISVFRHAGTSGPVGSLGTAAGTRLREPVRLAYFRSQPAASELFAFRYLCPTASAQLRAQRERVSSVQGYAGEMPGWEW